MKTRQNFHTPETNHTHCNIHLLLPQLPITELSYSVRSHETCLKTNIYSDKSSWLYRHQFYFSVMQNGQQAKY